MRAKWLVVPLILFSIGSIAFTKQDLAWIKAVKGEYGERAGKRVSAWRNLIEDIENQSENEKLEQVNRFFNQLYFVDDIKLWGKKDYWATPLEFLGSNAGDCEDFTIAKYFSLLELGVPDKKLRLIYLKALELNQFHMVLAYYPTPSAIPLILDNLDKEIKPATQRTDLLPIYSFNGQHLWLMKGKGNGQQAGRSSRLSLWNDLRQRNKGLRLNHPIINYDE
jgi:predicted transglutaminase-like cysteine proteinase